MKNPTLFVNYYVGNLLKSIDRIEIFGFIFGISITPLIDRKAVCNMGVMDVKSRAYITKAINRIAMLDSREIFSFEKVGRKCGRRCARWRSSITIAASVIIVVASAPAVAASASYTYDALGRLTKVVYSDGTKTSTVTYNYDAAGNRTSVASTSPS